MNNGKQTPKPTRLVVSRAEAAQKIKGQIKKGLKIRDLTIKTKKDLEESGKKRSKWINYNRELLSRLFSDTSIAEEFEEYIPHILSWDPLPFWFEVEDFRKDMDVYITRLESIFERLDLIPESGEEATLPALDQIQHSGNDVFIVHGSDEAAKESVARFIERLDLNSIILHEQPNAGRTIIEKFEEYSNVGFAIVLLTPDDICASEDEKENLKPRARQNVIFELGYFIGRLGRERVCALYKKDVEIFSDYQGVLYVPMDSNDGWQLKLAKEIKAAGIDVDMNKIV
ncbi:MAG: TIR domain-containing protein [Candidatus Syntropharchaeales archaeon]